MIQTRNFSEKMYNYDLREINVEKLEIMIDDHRDREMNKLYLQGSKTISQNTTAANLSLTGILVVSKSKVIHGEST